MTVERVLKFGFFIRKNSHNIINKEFTDFLPRRHDIPGRIAIALADYLVKYRKEFDRTSFINTDEPTSMLPNGTLTGLHGYFMRSEIDIVCQPFRMSEREQDWIDFAYPYELSYSTFMTRKQEYEPHIFGIFQAFSFSVWITLISTLLLTILMNHFLLKWKHPFDKISLHV